MRPVSLVITSYNREQYLAEAVESVLAQTYPHFELLIWDDGSQDGSLDIAYHYAELDPRIRVEAAQHQGLSPSLHNAIASTAYPYLGWVDSDDKLSPTALAETVEILEAQPQTGLVYTHYQIINADGEIQGLGERCHRPYSKKRLLVEFMTFHFRLIRRTVYDQVGGINPTFERAEDYDLCLRLSEVTQIQQLKRPLYFYRQHAGNVTNAELEMLRWTHKASQAALRRQGMSDLYDIQLNSTLTLRRKPETLPLVSIIITSYNSVDTLEYCLQSCFSQTYSKIEVLVVDNNSTDGTLALLERISDIAPCPFRIFHCPDQGQNFAHNCGFQQAKGNYIQWLDADDQLEPKKIAKQVTALEKEPSADIAYGDWQWCFYQDQKLVKRLAFPGKQYRDFLLQLLLDNWRPPHAYLLRKAAANHLHKLKAWNPTTTACTDREYYTLAALEGFHFIYVPDASIRYNSGLSAQVTRSTPYQKRVSNLNTMFQRFQHNVMKNNTLQVGDAHRFLLEQNWELWQPAFSLVKSLEEGCCLKHNVTGERANLPLSEATIIQAWLKLSGAYTLEDHARRIVRQLWQEAILKISKEQGAKAAADQSLVNAAVAEAVGLGHERPISTSQNRTTPKNNDQTTRNNTPVKTAEIASSIVKITQDCPLYAPMFNEQRLRIHSVLELLRQKDWLTRVSTLNTV